MSLYAQAMSSGMAALEIGLTGANATSRAAYNTAYVEATRKAGVLEAKHATELNMSAIAQDRITSNTHIRMLQDSAEAQAIVNAAAAGVEGGSVRDVINSTETNAVLAKGRSNQAHKQQLEQQKSMIVSQQSAMLSVDEPEISYAGSLMSAFSSFELSDIKISESLNSKGYNLSLLGGN